MKRLLSIVCMVMLSTMMTAVPAKRVPFTVTQRDGTQLTLVLVGDENMHYYENVTTGEKMQRGEDGDYHIISAIAFGNMQSAAKARMQQNNARRKARLAPRKIGSFNNMTGQKKGIVILVNFSDKAMTTGTQAEFNNMFNQEGYSSDGHIGSVSDYFKSQSYGLFELDFDVVGPVTLSNNMAYYGGNDSSGSDQRPAHMVKEACNLVNSQVNFADYDWDGDGYVDQVFVIYAGHGENYNGADENTIWPHEWDFVSAGIGVLSVDGVKVKTYACCAELYGPSGSTLNGMGTACHEFSHCLGYPDSYDTDYSGGVGMDSYDVMCGGSYNGPNGRGEVPGGYTAYERWMAGWLTPTELNTAANITDMPDLGSTARAYIIYNNKTENEYFLLENRQAKDWFKYYDYNTAGHGLFITHIDYNATVWSNNEPNDDPDHQRMTWVPADKNYGTYSSSNQSWSITSSQQKGDYFPGTSKVTAFTPSSWTSVGGKWFNQDSNGTYYSDHSLSEISENTTAGTISFKFDGGITDDGSRYKVTFNAGTGTCTTSSWTQTSYGQGTTLPTCTINNDEWTFIGWCTQNVSNTTTKPTIKEAGSSFTPSSDCTLYAVYKHTESGSSASGSYTLDYSEQGVANATQGYGNAVEYTATDGSTWVIQAHKNEGMQINKDKHASIKVPECPSAITTIDITDKTAKVLSFSDTDYTGSNSPTVAASSASSSPATINLSGKNMTTGYIFTTDGATVITKIVVNYGGDGSSATVYSTNPDLVTLATPTISFTTPDDKAMLVGDTYENIATATCPDVVLPTVTYSSSVTSVATVDANGKVTAVGVGTTTITASVAKVDGKSKAVFTTYKITVTMPELSGIEVTTLPTKTAYTEGETFDKTGMVVTANYANGYSNAVTNYSCSITTIGKDDTKVTISYTEGGVTKTADVAITVTALPRYIVTFNAGTGTCATSSLTEVDYQGGVTLPSCNDASDDWKFAGWATSAISEGTTTKPTLLIAGANYKPTTDCTLYAVFKLTEGEEERWKKLTASQVTEAGAYALITPNNNAFNGEISSGHGQSTSKAFEFNKEGYADSAPEGTCVLTFTASGSGFTMYNADKGYLYASAASSGNLRWHSTETSYWLYKNSSWIYNSNSAYLRTYNNDSFRTYGNSSNSPLCFAQLISTATITYHSTPSTTLVTPTIAFTEVNAESKAMFVGDDYTNTATATDTEQEVVYSSSDETIATVSDAGVVTALKVGTATITASIPAVIGVSKAVSASYQVMVTMPALANIAVTTPPTKTTYNEGETLSIDGIVVTATYENGYKQTVATFACEPSTSTALTTSDTEVTVSYTEGEVTKTTTFDIIVNALPKYTVTFNVCGKTTMLTETAYQSGVVAPSVENTSNYTFFGWFTSAIPEETTTAPVKVTLTEGKFMPTEDTTLYAVYKRTEQSGEGETTYEIETSVSGFPTSYGTPNTLTISGVTFNLYNVGHFNNSNLVQFKKSIGYISNSTVLPSAITRIVVDYASSSSKNLTLEVGTSDSSSTEVSATSNGNVYTFDCSGKSSTYFKLAAGENTITANSITIVCGSPAVNYFTTAPEDPEYDDDVISFAAHNDDGYWATFSRDGVTFIESDATVYAVDVEDSKLKLTQLPTETIDVPEDGEVTGTFIPAETGVLLNSQENEVFFYNVTYKNVAPLEGNLMKPASEEMSDNYDGKYYKLAYGNWMGSVATSTGLGFWWGADNGGAFTCKAGTAYLAVPSASAAKGFVFDESSTVTGIVEMSSGELDNGKAYNLAGQSVDSRAKGIIIINGRKFLRK